MTQEPVVRDPLIEADEAYESVRSGLLDVFCDQCGMLGKGDTWPTRTANPAYTQGILFPRQCPNCREMVVRWLKGGFRA